MYLNILKKDMKRKKTMNVILLIFIILSSMFVASSVNNILSVTSALDNFFEMSDVTDYFLALKGKESAQTMEATLSQIDSVTSAGYENIILAESDAFSIGDTKLDFKSTSIVMAFDNAQTKYFDMKNEEITGVEKGYVTLSVKAIESADIKIGDIITIEVGSRKLDLEVKETCKDAVLGSDLMGMTRFLLNESDFEYLFDQDDKSVLFGTMWYINTSDIDELTAVVNNTDNIFFNGDRSVIKMAYALDMVIAGVLLVVSVCLILVAFVVLKFTITFTLSEEFREIGVMKAIGIKNTKIRMLYLVKYFAMALCGSFIGFFASIPFSKLLLDSVSKSIVLKGQNTILTNLLCCIAVVLIIMLFCYLCTSKVKKFTPIDAIRNGQTGERYSKKSFLKLSKSKTKPAFFMALNDILSAPRRYLSIIFTYVLCMIIVLVLVNTANTLRSGELISVFGTYKSDVFFSAKTDELMDCITIGEEELFYELIDDIEEEIGALGMPCRASVEVYFKLNYSHGDKSFKSLSPFGINTTTDMYEYHEGSAPQNPNEIAITPMVAQKLDAKIGDTITVSLPGGDKECIVTAIYQSMNNLGEGVRLHQDTEIDFSFISGCFSVQFDFTDSPDEKTIAQRIEKLKSIYGDEDVLTASEMVETVTGVASAIDAVKYLTLALVIIIIALVTVLMERSFIAKELGEIATLKAIGFKTSSIVLWHSMRFIYISIASSIVAVIISAPVTKLTIDPIFKMLGAAFGVEYRIVPLEVFLIYPAILLVATIISAMLTSLYTKTITASQAAGIE